MRWWKSHASRNVQEPSGAREEKKERPKEKNEEDERGERRWGGWGRRAALQTHAPGATRRPRALCNHSSSQQLHTHAAHDTNMHVHTMHSFGCSTYTITGWKGFVERASQQRECNPPTPMHFIDRARTRVHTNSPPTGAWILRLCSWMWRIYDHDAPLSNEYVRIHLYECVYVYRQCESVYATEEAHNLTIQTERLATVASHVPLAFCPEQRCSQHTSA